jgi:ABC-type transport system substrate-binding protein
VPNQVDRRTFLTHSAATVGGVAMAGTVVDTLISGVAGATSGVGTGTPVTGGTLKVGLASDAPKIHTFTGQTGKWDAAGFCVGAAVFDSLFVTNKAVTGILPNLAVKATGTNSFKTWTIDLRQGVKFHSGADFNADAVVANFVAAQNDGTVGAAIAGIIDGCTKSGTYQVQYHTHFPFATFPYTLAEQQIAFMADPAMFAPDPSKPHMYTFAGLPSGTGPFVCTNWQQGVTSQFTKNSTYWRQDSVGRKLPYLGGVDFKTIPDPGSMLNSLKGGSIDMGIFGSGPEIKSIQGGVNGGNGHHVTFVTDLKGPRDPAMNMVMCNVLGTDSAGNIGNMDSSGGWHTGAGVKKSPISYNQIRLALAHALNRPKYLSGVDSGIGVVSDGVFRSTSPFYKNPLYPTLSVSAGKTAVTAYRKAVGIGPSAPINITMQTVSNSNTAATQFLFVKAAAATVGITMTAAPVVQSTLIGNAISKKYECSAWSQFGGAVPELNYVWWNSVKAFGKTVAGYVNFPQNIDPIIEAAMLKALATTSLATRKTSWNAVNHQFAKDLPYLFLDTTVSVWAAASNVQNYANGKAASASSVKSTVAYLNPDGPVATWAEIWMS